MELDIGDKQSVAIGDFGDLAAIVSKRIEGRRQWKSPRRLVFETTQHNLRVFAELFPSPAERNAANSSLEGPPAAESGSEASVQRGEEKGRWRPSLRVSDFPFRAEPWSYQLANFERFREAPIFAIFSDPGTGKTKTFLDIVSYRASRQMATGLLVLSSPKGIHAQWIEEQIPKHLWEGIAHVAAFWDGKRPPPWLGKRDNRFQIFSGNIEMLAHERSRKVLWDFARSHGDKLIICDDESDNIKNLSSIRSKELRKMADAVGCRQRAIMTGTPIAKDLTDEWAQFYFLDPGIIGHKYKTSFMAQFCIMGGFENRSVVGHRNVEEFKRLTAPYIFRATKAELDLPPKVYDSIAFDMTDEQRKMVSSIRDNFMAEVASNGDRVVAKSGAVAMLRMQQISCGFYIDEEENVVSLNENPRYSILRNLLDRLEYRKTIIWCRFRQDIEYLKKQFSGDCVHIYGGMTDKQRAESKAAFLDPFGPPLLVANADTAGKGLDGLQSICSTAIYYSNSFNAINRWQSEDRIQRIGMGKESPIYFDLVARGSPDRGILRNLRQKKSLSNLVLDDIKEIITNG